MNLPLRRGVAWLALLTGWMGLAGSWRAMAAHDVVLRNATIYDGSGAAPRRGDVAIAGGKIVKIGELAREEAARVIDVGGRALAPGFIDLHAHLEPILQMPGAESAARQGVTTALGGPDGGGPSPFAEYLAQVEKQPLGINVAF